MEVARPPLPPPPPRPPRREVFMEVVIPSATAAAPPRLYVFAGSCHAATSISTSSIHISTRSAAIVTALSVAVYHIRLCKVVSPRATNIPSLPAPAVQRCSHCILFRHSHQPEAFIEVAIPPPPPLQSAPRLDVFMELPCRRQYFHLPHLYQHQR